MNTEVDVDFFYRLTVLTAVIFASGGILLRYLFTHGPFEKHKRK